MNSTEIKRIKPVTIALPESELLNESAALLGYKRPEETSSPGKLYDTLAALDIEILDARSVEQYMMAKCFEASQAAQKADHGSPSWYSTTLRYGFGNAVNGAATWGEASIEAYGREIPDFVLNKAVQIKKAMPEVEFRVHFLTQSPDPFLVARLKIAQNHYEAYYIEVWDEPEFKH